MTMPDKFDRAATKTFCVSPWIRTHLMTDGMATVRCISPDPLSASDCGQLRVLRHSLARMFHSPQMETIGQKLLDGRPGSNSYAAAE